MFPNASSTDEFVTNTPLRPPPICLAHIKLPATSRQEIKTLVDPFEPRLKTPVPGSKSTLPEKYPVVIMLPVALILTEYPSEEKKSKPPVICFVQIKFPAASNFV